MITTIIAFIIIFGILVIVHEFGHFIMAKKLGIMVREFSIGMGPKVFDHISNGTKYTIRLLPIGGYVRMANTTDDINVRPGSAVTLKLNKDNQVSIINASKNKQSLFKGLPIEVTKADLGKKLTISGYVNGDESKEKTFNANHDAFFIRKDGIKLRIAPNDVQYMQAPAYKKLIINFAGVFNNALLAIITFAIIAFIQGGVFQNTNRVNPSTNGGIRVAKEAGIKHNTEILAVDNHPTKNWDSLSNQIAKRPKQHITLTAKVNHKIEHFHFKTQATKQNGKAYGVIGIQQVLNHSFLAELASGFTQTWAMVKTLFGAIVSMVSGNFSLNDLGGPVAIFANTQQAAKYGLIGILQFLAFLSINLAIVNLLPIPALDGGKIVLNLYELIRRKPLSSKVQIVVSVIGFTLIFLLMILVTFNDIFRYFIK